MIEVAPDTLFIGALVLIGIFVVISVLGYLRNWQWTGLPYYQGPPGQNDIERRAVTLWAWMTLLVMPITVAIVAGFFAYRQNENTLRQNQNALRVQSQRARDEAFQSYLDQMSALILDHGLINAEKNSPVRDLARSRTLRL